MREGEGGQCAGREGALGGREGGGLAPGEVGRQEQHTANPHLLPGSPVPYPASQIGTS